MSGHSRPQIRTLERVGVTYLSRLVDLPARDLADALGYLAGRRGVDQANAFGIRSVVADGLIAGAEAVPAMSVRVEVGLGFAIESGAASLVKSPAATSVDSAAVMVNKRTASSHAIAAAPGSGIRYDLVEIGPSTSVDQSAIVDYWSAALKKFVPGGSADTVLEHGEGTIYVTTGTADAGLPAPTAGRIPLAAVRVATGATTVTAADVFDLRFLLADATKVARSTSSAAILGASIDWDTPDSGTVQKFAASVEGIAGAIPGAFRTEVAVSNFWTTDLGEEMTDRATLALIGVTSPTWLYAYLVTADDQGYRMSRSGVVTATGGATGEISHAGLLVWSHIAPDLVDGSMRPSAALLLPAKAGRGTVTPGTGAAVCVGAAYLGGGVSVRIKYGLRLHNGKASFPYKEGGVFGPPADLGAFTYYAASTGTTSYSSWTADWASTALEGALDADLYLSIHALNTGGGALRTFFVHEFLSTDTNLGRATCVHQTIVPTLDASSGYFEIVARNHGLGRFAPDRGTTRTGLHVLAAVRQGSSHSQGALSDPGTAAPTVRLLGYTWPVGPLTGAAA